MNIVIPTGAERSERSGGTCCFSQLHLRRLLRFLDNTNEWKTGILARQTSHAGEGARATLNLHTNLHTESQEINLAKAKAAAAATPPMTIVCSALRPGPVPV